MVFSEVAYCQENVLLKLHIGLSRVSFIISHTTQYVIISTKG